MTTRHKLRLLRSTLTEASPTADEPKLVDIAEGSDPTTAETPPSSRSTMAELEDEQLVALARDRDSNAAREQLYRRHAGFALNLATRISGHDGDAQDVVHDAFMRAFAQLNSLRKASAFRSWLGSIVVHGVRSRFRRQRWMRFFGLSGTARDQADGIDLDAIVNPTASPQIRAELAQVFALLRTLSADDRIAWSLRYVEGFDLRSAAELSGCSLATVKRRIRRAQQYVEAHFVDASDPSAPGEEDVKSEAPPKSRRQGRDREVAS